jgi:hypothetical protein
MQHDESRSPAPGEGWMHSHDGWYWSRTPDGGVEISTAVDPRVTHRLPSSSWASIVAHVSAAGETGDTYRAAFKFHQGGE